MGRLAEKHGVTLPTMTKIVSGLVDKGFVVREGDERDRRIVLLRLTGDGEALFAQVHQRIEARLAGLVEQMSQEERDALATGLRALHRVISSAGIATPSPTADPP